MRVKDFVEAHDPEAIVFRHAFRLSGVKVAGAHGEFLNWWMTGLGAGFALFLGRITEVSNFIAMRYLEKFVWLFGLSIALALLGKFCGTIALAKFRSLLALHKALPEIQGVGQVDLDKLHELIRVTYLPPFRWMFARDSNPLHGYDRAVQWGQGQTICMDLSLFAAIVGVLVLVWGFNT